jgi:hypothetical protein
MGRRFLFRNTAAVVCHVNPKEGMATATGFRQALFLARGSEGKPVVLTSAAGEAWAACTRMTRLP